MDLHKKFLEGLEKLNISIEEFKKFKYAGGNKGTHKKYFKLCKYIQNEPESKSNCICGHSIIENCYLVNNDKILIIGNCCVKKFLPKENQRRTCEDCGANHKNRKFNFCKDCQKKYCFECGKFKNNQYKFCYDCFQSKPIYW